MRVNRRPVYKLTFEFIDADGLARQTIVKTEQTGRLEEDSFEQLLYDPRRPSHAALLDHIPGEPGFRENGALKDTPAGAVARAMFAPVLSLLIVTAILLIKFAF